MLDPITNNESTSNAAAVNEAVKQGTEQAQLNELPSEVRVPIKGKEQVIPKGKAVELIERGMVAESAAAELKRERDEFRRGAQRYGQFEAFTKHLDSNPEAAKAVAAALADPRRVMSALEGSKNEDPDPEPNQAPVQSSAELEELRAEVRMLKEKSMQTEIEKSKQSLESQLKKEIGQYPWLEGKRGELASRQVLALMSQDSSLSLSAAVAVAANDVREAWEEVEAKKLDEQTRKKQLRTNSPSKGAPMTTTKEKLTQKDWHRAKSIGLDLARGMGLVD